MPLLRRISAVLAAASLLVAACASAAAGQVPTPPPAPPPPPPTAASLTTEVQTLLDTTAAQWKGMVDGRGVFQNPFAADVAIGHHSFVPPLLAYSLHRAGQRLGDPSMVAAAEATWPHVVLPERASSFDMIGAAYALQTLSLSPERRAQLTWYTGAYGIPITGRRCLLRPRCWGNLKLVDALALLAITGAGVVSPEPAARMGNPTIARTYATGIVNARLTQVADHRLRARIRDVHVRGTVLSDPPADPIAYHALTAFMANEAIAQLGPTVSPAAKRVQRELLDALSVLVAPDGDISYLGRGQGQTWVPALTAAALAAGARDAVGQPARAARYLAGAQRAIRRLAALHAGPYGFQVVPGAVSRTTTLGIDGYAHTVAYNGLALFGLTRALDALASVPPATPVGRLPGEGRLQVRDAQASGLGVVSDRRVWLAVHKTPTDANDLRHDFGWLALKRRTPTGWVDLLAPRPLTLATTDSGGPALIRKGRPITPTGFGLHLRPGHITVNGGYRARRRVRRGDKGYVRVRRILRRVRFDWRLTRRGAKLTVSGAERRDRFRILAWTPAGTGGRAKRTLVAAGARWRFDRPFTLRRLPGFHSGPIEALDALEVRLRAPRSGRFTIRIGS